MPTANPSSNPFVLHVADESGAEVISTRINGASSASSSSNSSINGAQKCALLSSFALFEDDLGLRTRATESGGRRILFGCVVRDDGGDDHDVGATEIN